MGMLLFSLAFFLLGPAIPSAVFDNQACVWFGMILKGIASNGMNAGYPDLVIGVDDSNGLVQVKFSLSDLDQICFFVKEAV